jgi:hypothetical protein
MPPNNETCNGGVRRLAPTSAFDPQPAALAHDHSSPAALLAHNFALPNFFAPAVNVQRPFFVAAPPTSGHLRVYDITNTLAIFSGAPNIAQQPNPLTNAGPR